MSDARATIGIGIDIEDLSKLRDVNAALQTLVGITSAMYRTNATSASGVKAVGSAAGQAEGDLLSLARSADILDESMTDALNQAEKSATGYAQAMRAIGRSLSSDDVKASTNWLESLFGKTDAKSFIQAISKDFDAGLRKISRSLGIATDDVKDLFAMERLGFDPRAVAAMGRAFSKEARQLDIILEDFKKTKAFGRLGEGPVPGELVRAALLQEKKQKYTASQLAGIPQVSVLKAPRQPLSVSFGAAFEFSPDVRAELESTLRQIGVTPFRGSQQRTVSAEQRRMQQVAAGISDVAQLSLGLEGAVDKVTVSANAATAALTNITKAAEQLTLGFRTIAQQINLGLVPETGPAETGRRRKKATTTQGAMPAQAEGPLVSPPPGAAAAAGAASEQLKWTEGWKLHLNAAKDPAVRAKINQALNEMKQAGEIQAFKEGMADPGKEFTVYIGELDKAVDIARKINDKFGSLLKTVTQADAQMETDVRIIGEIFARFDSHDLRFNRYGFQGIQALKSDMQMSSSPGQPHGRLISGLFGTPISEETFKAARQDAYDTLAQMYGQAFTGSTNRFTIGAAGPELAIGGAGAPPSQAAGGAGMVGGAGAPPSQAAGGAGMGGGRGLIAIGATGGAGGGGSERSIPFNDIKLAMRAALAVRRIGKGRLAMPEDALTGPLNEQSIRAIRLVMRGQESIVNFRKEEIDRIRQVNSSLADRIGLEREIILEMKKAAAISDAQINRVRKLEGDASAEKLRGIRSAAREELKRVAVVARIVELEKQADEAGRKIYGESGFELLKQAISIGENFPFARSNIKSKSVSFALGRIRTDPTIDQRLAAGIAGIRRARAERAEADRVQRMEQEALASRVGAPLATSGSLAQNLAITELEPLARARKLRELMIAEQDESIRRMYARELASISQSGAERIEALLKARRVIDEIGRLQQSINNNTSNAEKKRINQLIEGMKKAAESEMLPMDKAAQLRQKDIDKLSALLKIQNKAASSTANQLKKTDEAAESAVSQLNLLQKAFSRIAGIKYNPDKIMDAYYQQFKGRMPSKDIGLTKRIEENERALDAVFRAGFRLKMVGMDLQYAGRRIIDTLRQLSGGYEEFEFTLLRAAGSLGDWAVDTGDNTEDAAKNFDYLKEKVIDTSMSLKLFTADEIGKALYFYASTTGQAVTSTQDLDNTLRILQPIMATAAMTNTGYEETIKGVYAVVSQFNPELVAMANGYVEGISAQKGYNLLANRMIDITQKLFYATQATAAEFSDLISSFKMVGPVAAQAGASFEDMIDLVSRLSDIGIKGTMSGRGLRQMFIQMVRPSPAARKAYEQLFARVRNEKGLEDISARGVTYGELVFPGGEFKGTSQYINDLARALRLVTPEYKAFILARITTANELPILTALVNEEIRAYERGGQVFSKTSDISVKAAKRFEIAFNALVNSGKAVFAGLDRTVEALRLTIGENVVEALKPFVLEIQNIILRVREWMLGNGQLVRDISAIGAVIGGLALAVGTLSVGLGTLVGFGAAVKLVLSSFLPVFPSIIGGISLIVAIVSNAIKEFDALQASFQSLQDAISSGANDANLNIGNVIDTVTDLGGTFSDISIIILSVAKSIIDATASLVRFSKEIDHVGNAIQVIARIATVFFAFKLTKDILRVMGVVKGFEKVFIGSWKTITAEVDGTVDHMGKTYKRGEEILVRQDSLVKRISAGLGTANTNVGRLAKTWGVLKGIGSGLFNMLGTGGIISLAIGAGLVAYESDLFGIRKFFEDISYSAEKAKDRVSELAAEFGSLQYEIKSSVSMLAATSMSFQGRPVLKTVPSGIAGEPVDLLEQRFVNPLTREVSYVKQVARLSDNGAQYLPLDFLSGRDAGLLNAFFQENKDRIDAQLESRARAAFAIQNEGFLDEDIVRVINEFAQYKRGVLQSEIEQAYLVRFRSDLEEFNAGIAASTAKQMPPVSESTYFDIFENLRSSGKIFDYEKLIEASNIILTEAVTSGGTPSYADTIAALAEKGFKFTENDLARVLKGTEFSAITGGKSEYSAKAELLKYESYYNNIILQAETLRNSGKLTVQKLTELFTTPIKVPGPASRAAGSFIDVEAVLAPAIDVFGDPAIAAQFPYFDQAYKGLLEFLQVSQAQFEANAVQYEATADAIVIDSLSLIKNGILKVTDFAQAEGVAVIQDVIVLIGQEFSKANPNLEKVASLYLDAWQMILDENVTALGPETLAALESVASLLIDETLLPEERLTELRKRFAESGAGAADDVASLIDSLRQGVEDRVRQLRAGRLGDIDKRITAALSLIVSPANAGVPSIPGFMGVSVPGITDQLGMMLLGGIQLDNGMTLRDAYLAGVDISKFVVDPAVAEVVNAYLKGLVDEGVLARQALPISAIPEDRLESLIATRISQATALGVDPDKIKEILSGPGLQTPSGKLARLDEFVSGLMKKSLLEIGLMDDGKFSLSISEINSATEGLAAQSGQLIEYVAQQAFSQQRTDISGIINSIIASEDTPGDAFVKIAYELASYVPPGYTSTLRELWTSGKDLSEVLGDAAIAGIVENYFTQAQKSELYGFMSAQTDEFIDGAIQSIVDTWNGRKSIIEEVKKALNKPSDQYRMRNLFRTMFGGIFGRATRPGANSEARLLAQDYLNGSVESINAYFENPSIRGRRKANVANKLMEFLSTLKIKNLTPTQKDALFNILPSISEWADDVPRKIRSIIAGIDIDPENILSVNNTERTGFFTTWLEDEDPSSYKNTGVATANAALQGVQSFLTTISQRIAELTQDGSKLLVDSYEAGISIGTQIAMGINEAIRTLVLPTPGTTTEPTAPDTRTGTGRPEVVWSNEPRPGKTAREKEERRRAKLLGAVNTAQVVGTVTTTLPGMSRRNPMFKEMLNEANRTGRKIPEVVTRAVKFSRNWSAYGRNIGMEWGMGWSNGARDGVNNALIAIRATTVGNSPPKEGPLRDIRKGGRNIGEAWGNSFSSAAVSSIRDGARMARQAIDVNNREFAHRGNMDLTFNRNDKRKIEISLNVTGDGSANRATMSELRKGLMDALVMADLEHMVEVM